MDGLIKRTLETAAPWQDVDATAWSARWPDFSPREMACKGSGLVPMTPEAEAARDALQAMRKAVGRSLKVTSAYRSPAHNKRVGGASNSHHQRGIAFDVAVLTHDPRALEHLAIQCGAREVGRYWRKGFIHVAFCDGEMEIFGKPWPAVGDWSSADEGGRDDSPATRKGGAIGVLGGVAASAAAQGVAWEDVSTVAQALSDLGAPTPYLIGGAAIMVALAALWPRQGGADL